MVDTQQDPLIGKILAGRFRIIGLLGKGGMGRVYRAIQRPIEREVALKIVNPQHGDARFEERFFFEALTTAKLRHPNIVTLHDYGRAEEGIYYMALELLEGPTLQQVLKNEGPMAWPRALSIGAQVARAMHDAHQLGLVHRDLKPANIMLLPEIPRGERVKLLDFGLVKEFLSLAEASRRENRSDLTSSGLVFGSPLYMAPEQAQQVADARSDIYSLGAVLYTAIAGRTPFLGKKALDLLIQHIKDTPPPLERVTTVPMDVNALVMRCLEKDPEARFQSMDEVVEAMHGAVIAHGYGGLYVTATATKPEAAAQLAATVAQEAPPATPAIRLVPPPLTPQPLARQPPSNSNPTKELARAFGPLLEVFRRLASMAPRPWEKLRLWASHRWGWRWP